MLADSDLCVALTCSVWPRGERACGSAFRGIFPWQQRDSCLDRIRQLQNAPSTTEHTHTHTHSHSLSHQSPAKAAAKSPAKKAAPAKKATPVKKPKPVVIMDKKPKVPTSAARPDSQPLTPVLDARFQRLCPGQETRAFELRVSVFTVCAVAVCGGGPSCRCACVGVCITNVCVCG